MLAVHGWTIHLTVYAAVNSLLIFFWLLTTGSVDALQEVAANPTTALDEGFWPIWPLALGACALVIHTGVAFSNGAFGFQARRRRRRRRREVQRAWDKTTSWAASMATAKLEAKRNQAGATVPVGTRQWVAVMFTDIADSTPLTAELGDDTWREVLSRHRATVRAHVDDCAGREVSTQGDSFFVRFDEVTGALRCAIAIQRSLAAEREGDDLVPETRIGLHAGEVVADDGGDLLGHVVNLASRVTGVATAGEILVTESVADLAPSDIAFVDRGLETLKGVPQPRHLLAVKWEAD
jgi:eukaryotic-like serine/threonine-protein kinase